MASVIEQIRKLDEQKAQLLQTAKDEALKKANDALAELRELGFNYRIAEMDRPVPIPREAGARRTGIRDQVWEAVKGKPGITRAQLLDLLDAKGNKSAEQSISNALAALKRDNKITAENGSYSAA